MGRLLKFQFRGFSQKGPPWPQSLCFVEVTPALPGPPPLYSPFPQRLAVVAAVAKGLEVIQHQPQVRTNGYRNPMVGVQMPLPAAAPLPQFLKHVRRWSGAEFAAPEVRYDLRFPPTFRTAPRVALKTEDTKFAVVRIITAHSGIASLLIVLPAGLTFVPRAVRPAIAENATTGCTARTLGCARHGRSASRNVSVPQLRSQQIDPHVHVLVAQL